VRSCAILLAAVLFAAMPLTARTAPDTVSEQEPLRSPVDGPLVLTEEEGAEEHHVSTGEKLALRLRERGLSSEAVVFVIAMLPIVELRGAVPVGINVLGMAWYRAVLWSVVGNMVPIFLILLLLNRAVGWLSHIRFFRRFFDWLFARTRRKSGLIERYEFWGLMLFVSIPLPVTGAWTGSVAAVIMGVPYWRAMLAIFCGVLIAGGVVTVLSLLGIWGAVIAGVALAVLAVNGIVSGLRRRKRERESR